MQLDKLQIDLRPRPNAQALDLGFTLLRSHAGGIYAAWLALWLPLVALCGGLAYLSHDHSGWSLLIAWWLRPLLERAPLYMLSRQVFGETVTWQEALRAWPRQLGGGWLRMLTWWRPTMPGRGLYQAIWQLEGARGAVAGARRKIIGGNNTGSSAAWFGVVCAHFEAVLQFGFIAFVGIFMSHENAINPFAYIFGGVGKADPALIMTVVFTGYALAVGIIAPIYCACCFTLYLNRRATLEAWDIEIMLRQIKPPAAIATRNANAAAALLPFASTLLALALSFSLYQPGTVSAAEIAPAARTCAAPKWIQERTETRTKSRGPDQSAEQTRLRREIAALYESDDLRGYVCEDIWQLKNPADPPKLKNDPLPDLSFLAGVIKILLIAAAIALVVWLLYRYRDQFSGFARKPTFRKATEIGGLDIRPETLPDDVAATVRQLWDNGQLRAALALLYRATLSRLVNQDGLSLTQGATEGDCLRAAGEAHRKHDLSAARFEIAGTATSLWLNGAYGGRWPDTATVIASCTQWQSQFDNAGTPARSQP